MNLLLLNPLLNTTRSLETYETMIWTERYDEYGDFEMTYKTSMITVESPSSLLNQYIYSDVTNKLMIIESIEISYDVDDGYTLYLKGKSLESLLSRRIISTKKSYSGNLQTAVKSMIMENIINPVNTNRKIDNFVFVDSIDPLVTGLTIENEYLGEDLYTIISTLCSNNKIGFEITLNDETKQLEFRLYAGVDRSADQYVTPYILFGSENGSILNSNYLHSLENYKNIVYVAGESTTIEVGASSGILRRESYYNASGVETSALDEKGQEELTNSKAEEIFDIESNDGVLDSEDYGENYGVYRKTYFLGDLVETDNTFGSSKPTRVREFIYSIEPSGHTFYPTLTSDDDENTL